MARKILGLAVAVGSIMLVVSVEAAVRTAFGPSIPFSGPPYYAFLDRPPIGEIFRDEDWVAVPFVRDPNCLLASNPGFDLLDSVDIPGAFFCPLTVSGFAIWKNGPPPDGDIVPIQAYYTGLGSVPVWFALWADVEAAMADGHLTIQELHDIRIDGFASFFEAIEQPGPLRPQGFGNGKIEIVTIGTLSDGRTFIFTSREMGVDAISTQRHTLIEFGQ
jgi:hypothetical protein